MDRGVREGEPLTLTLAVRLADPEEEGAEEAVGRADAVVVAVVQAVEVRVNEGVREAEGQKEGLEERLPSPAPGEALVVAPTTSLALGLPLELLDVAALALVEGDRVCRSGVAVEYPEGAAV